MYRYTLALSLRDKLRLRLFNFDLIRVNGGGCTSQIQL